MISALQVCNAGFLIHKAAIALLSAPPFLDTFASALLAPTRTGLTGLVSTEVLLQASLEGLLLPLSAVAVEEAYSQPIRVAAL